MTYFETWTVVMFRIYFTKIAAYETGSMMDCFGKNSAKLSPRSRPKRKREVSYDVIRVRDLHDGAILKDYQASGRVPQNAANILDTFQCVPSITAFSAAISHRVHILHRKRGYFSFSGSTAA